MYKAMVTVNTLDNIFYDAQRQGRISFYMTGYGEEATTVGSCAALDFNDVLFPQYREQGALYWRGFSLQMFANQCFSNHSDLGKGRQMPVHYGSKALNIQTVSSPLATQIPHAAGAAYALKMEGKENVTLAYFGDGSASEGDFHTGMNFAATLSCPVVFFCRNNGYAISTPTNEQYKGDGIISRASGYGIPSIRVDGNDLLAVHDATAAARKMALESGTPVLVEAMSYRGGHHSTSDDSTRYRESSEIQDWADTNNPLTRSRKMLEQKNLWDADQEAELKVSARKEVLAALSIAEKQKKPAASQLFTDIYDKPTEAQLDQMEYWAAHTAKYADQYPLTSFEPEDQYVDPSPSTQN
jgi:2-oxoisovalerate dehydrogenase E1 component alpha subunit